MMHAARDRRGHGRGQRGVVSLPEILAAISVLVAGIAIVTTLVVQANNVSRNNTVSTQTQAELLDAVSRVTRDIAFSDPILSAPSGVELWTQTMQGGDCIRTRYFVGPAQTDPAVDALKSNTWTATGIGCADAPVPAATDAGDGPVTDLVTGLNLQPGDRIFTYYDVNDVELATPVTDVEAINRVGITLSAAVEERPNGLELTTSVTPRSGFQEITGPTGGTRPDAPTGLSSSGCTNGTVTLTWPPVAGATGYTVMRDGVSQQPVLIGGTATTFTQGGLGEGRDYVYRVISSNASGLSDFSAPITVTCLPGVPTLSGVTINASGDGAINDNRLTWTRPANQVLTGYNLYRNGVPVTTVNNAAILTYTDLNRPWGEIATYTVRAFNSRGQGDPSNAVDLQIRPAAPVVTGSTTDGWNHLSWAAVPTANCYNVYRDGTLYTNLGNTTSFSDGSPGWGSTHTYAIAACSDQGEGPRSNTVTLNQASGPFDIVAGDARQDVRYTDKNGAIYANEVGGARVGWTWSSGAVRYDVIMDGWNRFNVGNVNWSSWDYNTWTPGATVSYQIVAIAPNGLERVSAPKTVLVPPTPPANIHTSTWCKYDVRNIGWKYGMDVWTGPSRGYMDWVHLIDIRARSNGSDPNVSGWAYYYAARDYYVAPAYTWQTFAWGGLPDPSAANSLSNVQYEGGGMLIEALKNGSANFGNNWSARIERTAIKQATGAVACTTGNTDWSYNGNAGLIMNWDWF